MMMEAAPTASLIVAEPEFLFEFLIVALDAPAQLGGADELCERSGGRESGEPVFEWFGITLGPFDQQPFLGAGLGQFVIPGRGPDAHGGEARVEVSVVARR